MGIWWEYQDQSTKNGHMEMSWNEDPHDSLDGRSHLEMDDD